MSDPLRSDPSRLPEPVSEAERDAKIEQLLLAGLDHYFASRYEQAINVWTRALFFDRGHARARAYIERARSALAERQRESEELLQNGLAAFGRGESQAARRLLRSAIDQGAPSDEALAVLSRLDRLEYGQTSDVGRLQLADEVDSSETAVWRSRGRRSLLVAASILLLTLAGLFLLNPDRQWATLLDLSRTAPAPQTAPPFLDSAPELPRRGEMALDLARTLVAGGRLRDALAALDSVRDTDPERGEADRLRADVQKQLIALAGLPAVPTGPDGIVPRQP